jgi:hypothetical protein
MPDEETHAHSNFLSVSLQDLSLEIVGIRAPMFKRVADTRAYWEKLSSLLQPHAYEKVVIIGDLNADPANPASVGGRYLRSLKTAGWQVPQPNGGWSYISAGGRFKAPIDHVMAGRSLTVRSATYLHDFDGVKIAGSEPGKTPLSDHAILVAEIGEGQPAEIILEVLAEGGSISLYGQRHGSAWRFARSSVDQTPELLGEPWIAHDSEVVQTWPAALALLDEYPWARFSPVQVHPEFRERVLNAVLERAGENARHLTKWRKLCLD